MSCIGRLQRAPITTEPLKNDNLAVDGFEGSRLAAAERGQIQQWQLRVIDRIVGKDRSIGAPAMRDGVPYGRIIVLSVRICCLDPPDQTEKVALEVAARDAHPALEERADRKSTRLNSSH